MSTLLSATSQQSGGTKACSIPFEPGAPSFPDMRNEGSKSIAKKVAADAAKHADRQHRASQRCIPIAPEHKLMKRISTPSPPVQPATSRALGPPWSTARRKQQQVCRNQHPSPARWRAAFEAKSACQRMGLVQRILFAQGEPGVHTSVADCHSTSKETRRTIMFINPTSGMAVDERTNRWSERRSDEPRTECLAGREKKDARPVAKSRAAGKLRVASAPGAGIAGVAGARLALRQR
jgi:hypothetical protein